MPVIFKKTFITLQIRVPDETWARLDQEAKAEFTKEIERRSEQLSELLGHASRPVILNFMNDLDKLETAKFLWRKVDDGNISV